MAVLEVRVVSPEQVVFEGQAAGVVAPVWDGQVGILPGHAPMVALLGAGALDIDLPGGGSDRFHLAGGVIKVEANRVTVLTEFASVEEPAEIPPGLVVEPEDFLEGTSPGNPLA